MTTDLKFCKDCKHYQQPDGLSLLAGIKGKCQHSDNLRWNLEGGYQFSVSRPVDLREEEAQCGVVGYWFEAKPPEPVPAPKPEPIPDPARNVYAEKWQLDMQAQQPWPFPEEVQKPGWGHPIMLLAYAVVALVGWGIWKLL